MRNENENEGATVATPGESVNVLLRYIPRCFGSVIVTRKDHGHVRGKHLSRSLEKIKKSSETQHQDQLRICCDCIYSSWSTERCRQL